MPKKIAVIVWLYHTEIWPELLFLLKPLNPYIKLYMCLCEDHSVANKVVIDDIQNSISDFSIKIYPNIGGDVSSFLHEISNIDPNEHPLFIKLHSKTSILTKRYLADWRGMLFNDLIGSKETLLSNINNFITNPKCGMIANTALLLKNHETSNHKKIKSLCNYLNIKYNEISNKNFIAGTMFMSRTSLFKKYFNTESSSYLLSLVNREVAKVEDRIDGGTFCHSLERVFCYLVYYNKLWIYEARRKKQYKLICNYSDKNKFHIIVLHNRKCYIRENPNLWGSVLNDTEDSLIIKWQDFISCSYQKYHKLNFQTIIQNKI